MNVRQRAVAFVWLFCSSSVVATDRYAEEAREWNTKPWEIRYLLYAAELESMKSEIRVATAWNVKEIGPKSPPYEFFMSAARFQPKLLMDQKGKPQLAIEVLVFDRRGYVISHGSGYDGWVGKRNMLDGIVAIPSENQTGRPYDLATWSQGVPGEMAFSPAVCSYTDEQRYRDNPPWERDSIQGAFGCREWTAQLYDSDQPYIDITSAFGRNAIIGDVLGWSRFNDPPKPVIGKHDRTWYCLYECPAGEVPGVIPDIRQWTTKHGYPMPGKPPRKPIYPNSRYREAFEIE